MTDLFEQKYLHIDPLSCAVETPADWIIDFKKVAALRYFTICHDHNFYNHVVHLNLSLLFL
jgi:hypothetical protein